MSSFFSEFAFEYMYMTKYRNMEQWLNNCIEALKLSSVEIPWIHVKFILQTLPLLPPLKGSGMQTMIVSPTQQVLTEDIQQWHKISGKYLKITHYFDDKLITVNYRIPPLVFYNRLAIATDKSVAIIATKWLLPPDRWHEEPQTDYWHRLYILTTKCYH